MTSVAQRRRFEQWLLEVTSIPTAAGREHRVVAWVDRWVSKRRNLSARRDRSGNIVIRIKGATSGRPVLLTAHLDHPAFVVKRVIDRRTLELEFRGGVGDGYFAGGRVLVYDRDDIAHRGRITELRQGSPFKEVTVRLGRLCESVERDDVGTWDLKPAHVKRGLVHAPACDDLAAVAAALSAIDVLRKRKGVGDVRVLLTRAEEVGFVGAIRACESGIIPRRAKVIALENSRSFAESPIGGGPIVRVGDRISIFHHGLTYEVCRIAEQLATKSSGFQWQRKLMPGGACEATAFIAFGYESTCICLPLGNYHNMGDLDAVLAKKNTKPPRIAAEVISIEDYHGLIDLLVSCGLKLAGLPRSAVNGADAIHQRLLKLRDSRGFVLDDRAAHL